MSSSNSPQFSLHKRLKYSGEYLNGKYHGHGTLTFADGEKYEGEFFEGKHHGHGTHTWSSGQKYIGNFRNDERNGHGTNTWPSGMKYVGNYKNDQRNGHGTLTLPCGQKYVGEFVDGKYHGHGTLTFPSGQKYEGEFVDGKSHGHGTLTWPCGQKYKGEFVDGKYHGHGTLTVPCGQKYEGEFVAGKSHGHGTHTWPCGQKYVGNYKNDQRNGHGTHTWPCGQKYVGNHKNDQRNGHGTLTWPEGRKYVGNFKNDQRNGHGTYTWPDGTIFIGEYKNDERQGHGSTIFPDGSKYEEQFVAGKPINTTTSSSGHFMDYGHTTQIAPIFELFHNHKNPIISIDDAVKRFPFDFQSSLWSAKQWVQTTQVEQSIKRVDHFTPDMAIAIWMYTLESPLYTQLNRALIDESRSVLVKHFFPYLQILITALKTLKAQQGCEKEMVHCGVPCDLVSNYPNAYARDKIIVWWQVTSTTEALSVLENPQFLGAKGDRTIFHLHTKVGVDVSDFSAIQTEKELILPPGTVLRITDILAKDESGLTQISCKDETVPSLIT